MAEAPKLSVLVVDDDTDMTRLLRTILARHGYEPVRHVTTGAEALAADGADVVLLDYQLPDLSGLEVIDALRARAEPPAIVIVTAHGSESLAAEALRRGASDYLVKDASLAELLPEVLERVRRERELRSALMAAERDLIAAERLAAIGEMTVTLNHEINNPLMAATAEVAILLTEPSGLTPDQRESLDAVRDALDRISGIVRRIGSLREARSRDYLAGVRMIDLAASAAPGRERTAVLCATDEALGRIVGEVLGRAGYRVQRCAGVAELAQWATAVGISTVVLAGRSGELLPALGPAAERGYRLVVISADGDALARTAGADIVLTVPFDPEVLVTRLNALPPAAPA